MLIFKGAPAPAGKPCGRKNTITHEIYHKLKDKWGNAFPHRDKCYITCTKTANSSGEKTLDFLHEVYFPAVGAEDGTLVESCGLLLDAFRGHFASNVKEVTEKLDNLTWLMMDGGITPKAQPLDVLINKIFKGFFRDLFEEWSLQAPVNPKTDHPLAPSRQLLAMWVVEAWDKVPVEIIQKAWVVCGYQSMEQLHKKSESSAIIDYTRRELGSMVEKICGQDGIDAWIDDANDPDPEFPEDSDEEDGDKEDGDEDDDDGDKSV